MVSRVIYDYKNESVYLKSRAWKRPSDFVSCGPADLEILP